MRSDGSKVEVGDVGVGPDGIYRVAIAVDETAEGVQIIRTQRTDRLTMFASDFYVNQHISISSEEAVNIRDGKACW
jgi:hypothetical protein